MAKLGMKIPWDVNVICWSHDERRVLVSIRGGKQHWVPVEYVQLAGETTPRGFIAVEGEKVCVFA